MLRQVTILAAVLMGLASCYIGDGQQAKTKRKGVVSKPFYVATVAYRTGIYPSGKGDDIAEVYLTEVVVAYSAPHGVTFKHRYLDKNGNISDTCKQMHVSASWNPTDKYYEGEESEKSQYVTMPGLSSELRGSFWKGEDGEIEVHLQSIDSYRGSKTRTAIVFDMLQNKSGDFISAISKSAKPKEVSAVPDNSYYAAFDKAIVEQAGVVRLERQHSTNRVLTTGLMSASDGIRKFRVRGRTFNKSYWEHIFRDACSEDDYRQHD